MNQTQERKLEMVRNQFKSLWLLSDSYEVKKEEITESDFGTIYFFIESGMKNDEGTFASIFCRDSIHISIGVRGGLTDLRTGKSISSGYLAKNK